jgi:hypothetical protein
MIAPPHRLLPGAQGAALRRRYHVEPHQFRVLVLGEDGAVKLSSDVPVSIERLNRLVDSMPTRKLERQERDSN